MSKAIDNLVPNKLSNLQSPSAHRLFRFRLYRCHLVGLHWTIPRFLKSILALLVDSASTCHLSRTSCWFIICALHPHILTGEAFLALPLIWLLAHEKPERLALLAGRWNDWTHAVCLHSCHRALHYSSCERYTRFLPNCCTDIWYPEAHEPIYHRI